ncbi:MAG: PaaI family thioesterase [Bacteroidales bacterium]|nr:PaaI family thioesterase [Bacteroidales bacterium]MBN2699603.1 PaaI family thioesterase [Bacteroidales bacterium]
MKAIHNPFAGMEGYNCFGCSPGNPSGLRLRFFEDEDEIVTFWEPEEQFEGWMNILHGGIQATLIDEIASWVVFVKTNTAGVTLRLNIRYRKPVKTGEGTISLRAGLKGVKKNIAEIGVKLFDNSGQLCSEGLAEYYLLPEEKAREALKFPGRNAFTGSGD